jgi:hypothetical protein
MIETITPKNLAKTITDKVGPDWILAFAPETLWTYFADIPELIDIPRSRLLQDKVLAIKTLLNSTAFWTDWHVFEKVIMTFNNIVPNFSIIQEPTIVDLYIGVALANEIREEKFSSEVATYVATVADIYGVTKLYYPLEFAQKALDDITNKNRTNTELTEDLKVLSDKLKNKEIDLEFLIKDVEA